MKKVLLAALVIFFISSCRKYPDYESLTYNPIVITNHDTKANFNDYKTYYLDDDITLIGDDPDDSIVSGAIGDPIVAAIIENMDKRGFTRVASLNLADLGLNTAMITVTTTVVSYPPSYWWGYPGYGGCYYGYCGYYPYYGYGYGYGGSYSYETGSLMVQMADLKNIDNVNHKINIVWTNFNNGVLGQTTTNVAAAVNSIDQAFAQSDYLKTN